MLLSMLHARLGWTGRPSIGCERRRPSKAIEAAAFQAFRYPGLAGRAGHTQGGAGVVENLQVNDRDVIPGFIGRGRDNDGLPGPSASGVASSRRLKRAGWTTQNGIGPLSARQLGEVTLTMQSVERHCW
jgi:hypothetical protein